MEVNNSFTDYYTNLEQSKTLANILPPESANLIYPSNFEYPFLWIEKPEKDKDSTLCWSLGALLNYIKDNCGYYEFVHIGRRWQTRCRENTLSNVYRLSTDMYEIYEEGAINTCYRMIIKLHEQKFI